MKAHTLLVLSIVFIAIAGCSKKTFINSPATNKETIDGDAEEWLGRMTLIDKNSGLQIAISNDTENLYLCIQSTKEQITTKILMGGLQLWIDPSGKGKKTTGIKYPLGGGMTRSRQPGGNTARNPDLKSLIENMDTGAEFIGFTPTINGHVNIDNTGDIKLKLAKTSAFKLVYEVKIPFHTFLNVANVESAPNLEFVYTILINGLERPSGIQGGSPSGMGPPPGGGAPRGGSPQGGPPPGQMPPSGEQSEMFNTTKVQLKAKLSL